MEVSEVLSVKEGGGGGGGEECSPVVRAVASAMVYRSSLHDFFFLSLNVNNNKNKSINKQINK